MKTTKEEGKNIIYEFVGEVLAAIIIILILGYPIMLTWNFTLPNVITGFNPISYWQACGLLAIVRLLFGRRNS